MLSEFKGLKSLNSDQTSEELKVRGERLSSQPGHAFVAV